MTQTTAPQVPTSANPDQDQVKQVISSGVGNPQGKAKLHASLGQLLIRQQRYAQAINELTQALELEPTNIAWRMLRSKAHQLNGDIPNASLDVADALMLDPTNAANAAHLGEIKMIAREYALASWCFAEAVRLAPNDFSHYRNLAKALAAADQIDGSVELYERLTTAEPTYEGNYLALAELYIEQRQPDRASVVCARALDNGLSSVDLFRVAGTAATLNGDGDGAAALYNRGLALDPENGGLKHLVNLTANVSADSTPAAYIINLFDKRAADYDLAVFSRLYRVPGLIRAEVLRVRPKVDPSRPTPYKLSAVLDIGCGTGLVGLMVQGVTAYLKGIDLSSAMVAHAQTKRVYQELEIAEAVASMRADPRLYECVVAGSTMEYIGKSDDCLAAIYKRLLPSGFAILTFVAGEAGTDYALGADGRFRHSRDYIERMAGTIGFDITKIAEETLETVDEQPINGFVVTLTRPLR
jgi:predicted TPR repeat methyltransferase